MGTKDTTTARWFAIAKHAGQKYGQHPYSYHLDDAVNELIDHVLDLPALKFYDHDLIICATYLHDVLEDTSTTSEEMFGLFDRRIVELVQAVTDGPGKNRAERKKGVYAAIRTKGPAALAVKLADRLANTKTCGLSKDESEMLKMYRREQTDFDWELRRPFAGVIRRVRPGVPQDPRVPGDGAEALKTHLTLTRKDARVKLTSAKRAQYFMQIDGGQRYVREASIEAMVRSFERDDRARLRIRLEDSEHVVTIENNEEIRSGYVVTF